MTKLKFKVGNLSRKDEADFCLIANSSWNDYCIETIYDVYAMPSITKRKPRKIGVLKIGTCEDGVKSSRLLHNIIGNDIWGELPYSIVSSFINVNLCTYLRENLTYEQRIDFIHSLHIIMGEDTYLERIKNSKVFKLSMCRNKSLDKYLEHIQKIRNIMITRDANIYTEGELVNCKIISIDGNFINVSLDDTTTGIALLNEVEVQTLEVGMELELVVVEDVGFNKPYKMSYGLVKEFKGWQKLKELSLTDKILRGKVVGRTDDGENFLLSMYHNVVVLPILEVDTTMIDENGYLEKNIVNVKIIDFDDENKLCRVSQRSVPQSGKNAKKIQDNQFFNRIEEGEIGTAEIIERIENDKVSGFKIKYKEVYSFIPDNVIQSSKKLKHPESFIGKSLLVKVLSIDEEKRKVYFSHIEAINDLKKDFLSKVEIGDTYDGSVVGFLENAVRIDLGVNVKCLIPNKELAWGHVCNPADYVSIGESIKVSVISIDRENQRLVLSRKQCLEDPWLSVSQYFKEGEQVFGVVRSLADFGAFIELKEGITGLIPNKELAWGYVYSPADYVSIGESIKVSIISINQEAKKISLSRKQCIEDPWLSVSQRFHDRDRVKGKIKRKIEHGVFVEFTDGVVGFLRESSMGWDKHLNTILYNELQVGTEIDVIISAIDVVNKKIELTQIEGESPWPSIKKRYQKNDTIKGVVTCITPNGSYVELESGVGGFIYKDEYVWPGEKERHLALNESLTVKVTRVIGGKIDLSIRRLRPNPLEAIAKRLVQPIEVVVKELDLQTQELLVEFNGYEGYIKRDDLAINLSNIADMVKVGEHLWVKCIGYGTRYLKFSKRVLDASIYPEELYSYSQEQLLKEMEIESVEFFGKVCVENDSMVLRELIVASNERDDNEDKGRLLADPLTGVNVKIVVSNDLSNQMYADAYYRVVISAVDESIRRKSMNPYTFTIQSVIEQVDNPYEELVKLSFTKHNSPSTNTSIAYLLNEVGENLYTGKKRMFYELLQNADDSSAEAGVQFSVETDGDYLIIAHDGKSFNSNDFESIISAAKSTKSANRKKTGYKGIGFKSVFTNTSKVLIKTGGYYFSFDSTYPMYQNFKEFYYNVADKKTAEEKAKFLKTFNKEYRDFKGVRDIPWQLLPIWEEQVPVELQDTLFDSDSNVAIAIKKNSIDILQVEESIMEILSNPIFMLFLRHAKRVQYQSSGEFATVSKEVRNGIVRISSSLIGQEKNKAYYELTEVSDIEVSDDAFKMCGIPIKKSLETIQGHDRPSEILVQYNSEDPDGQTSRIEVPDRIASASGTTISFAVPMVKGEVTPLKNSENSLYAYLPLEEHNFSFKLYVNADFVPTSDREGVQSNNPWNWFVFYNIGKKIVGEIAKFATEKNKEYLNLLQDKLFGTENGNLAYHFNRGYKEALLEEPFILGEDLQRHKQSEIVIDKTGLSQVVGSQVFYQITGTNRILPSFNIDTKILMDNCEVDDSSEDNFALFDLIEVIHIEDISNKLSNNENLLGWFKTADDTSRIKFYKWIVKNNLQSLANSLPIFTFGEEQLTREEIDSKSTYIISTETTQTIETILTKIGVKCSAQVWSNHPLKDVIDEQTEEVIFNRVKELIPSANLLPQEKWDLLVGLNNLVGVSYKSVVPLLVLTNKKGKKCPSAALTNTNKDYLKHFAISLEDYDQSIDSFIVPENSIYTTFFKKENIKLIFTKENILEVYQDYGAKWSSDFWGDIIDTLSCEEVLPIIHNAQPNIINKFLKKVGNIILAKDVYEEKDLEYQYYKVPQNNEQVQILLKKTYIDNELVSNYNICDDVKFTIDRTSYTLSVSELLPDRKTSIMQRFKALFPFVSVDLEELDQSQILAEIVECVKSKDVSPAQLVFLSLYNRTKGYTTYSPLTEEKVKNISVVECIDCCFTHNVRLKLPQFANVKGVNFCVQNKYFPHQKDVLLFKELLSAEIQKWADTDEKKQFLYDMGVHKSDNSVIKLRTDWLEGVDTSSNVFSSEETLEWIYTKSSEYLQEKAEKRDERISLLRKLLVRDYERRNRAICEEFAVVWSDNDKYLEWSARKNVIIKICPKGIPVELYHKEFTYCRVYEDTYYVEGQTIFISGISDAKDILKKVSATSTLFTIEDWYHLFSVSSDAFDDLQREKDSLNQRIAELERKLYELQIVSPTIGAGDDDNISKQKQKEAQLEAQKYLLSMQRGIWQFPIGYGELNDAGELNCFSKFHVVDADGCDMLIVLKSYKYRNEPFKINPIEWDSIMEEGAKMFIYTGNDIIEIDKEEIVKNQTKIAVRFSAENLDVKDKVQEFSDLLHYFRDIHFDFESFNITKKAKSIREIYNKRDGGQLDNSLNAI